MKKTFIFVLLIMIVFTTSVQAHENFEKKETSAISTYKPYIIDGSHTYEENTRRPTNCPYGDGICDAKRRGNGGVYVNNKFDFEGCCWQCTKCYTVFITYHNPLDGYIGDYAVSQWYEPIPLIGVSMYVRSTGFTSSATLPGVRFSDN